MGLTIAEMRRIIFSVTQMTNTHLTLRQAQVLFLYYIIAAYEVLWWSGPRATLYPD